MVYFQKDPNSHLNAGKFHNIITHENYSQRTLRMAKSLGENVITRFLAFLRSIFVRFQTPIITALMSAKDHVTYELYAIYIVNALYLEYALS